MDQFTFEQIADVVHAARGGEKASVADGLCAAVAEAIAHVAKCRGKASVTLRLDFEALDFGQMTIEAAIACKLKEPKPGRSVAFLDEDGRVTGVQQTLPDAPVVDKAPRRVAA